MKKRNPILATSEDLTPEVIEVFKAQNEKGEPLICKKPNGDVVTIVQLDFSKSPEELLESFMAYYEKYIRPIRDNESLG